MNKYLCLLLVVVVGFVQVDGKAIEEYSKMSAAELDAAFVSAVKGNCPEEIQELIQAGADVNTPISYVLSEYDCYWDIEETALRYAIRHNYPNIVKVIVEVEKELNEALAWAILLQRARVVEELVKGGADVNYADKDGDTPLILAVKQFYACEESKLQPKIIQTLLKSGVNVIHTNKYGRTALMEAVMRHDLDTVQSLLQIPEMIKGSFFGFGTKPINYADKDGNTALILAIKKVRCSYTNNREYKICLNSQEIIKALLEIPGIDPYHVNDKGETAISLIEELE